MYNNDHTAFPEGRQGRPTRADVALRAGVSEATVSRAFNSPGRVNDEKVRRVLDAAEALGYRPDKHASALRRRGTGVIIFLEYRRSGDYQWPEIRFFNWLYADILRTLIERVGRTQFRLELRSVAELEEIASLGRECDGILAFNVEEESYARAVAEAGVPYVCAHHTEDLKGFSRCSTDNFGGGKALGRAFRKAGSTSLLYATGRLAEVGSHRRRWAGFREGFGPGVELFETEIGIEGGVATANATLPRIRRGEIGAVAAVNDLTALGVIRELTRAGCRLPEECVVAGYDNLPVALGFNFTMPTVELNLGDLYALAAEELMAAIGDGRAIDRVTPPRIVPGSLLDRPDQAP